MHNTTSEDYKLEVKRCGEILTRLLAKFFLNIIAQSFVCNIP
jgi:hypothetical protein